MYVMQESIQESAQEYVDETVEESTVESLTEQQEAENNVAEITQGSNGATPKNCAIFILTQNTAPKLVYLKTALYFLFKYFNAKYKHPVVIFHEGDFDARTQTEVISGIRDSCRACVSFRAVDPDDFKVPDHIDKEKLDRCVATNPVPYWRNVSYRSMCRWWIVHMPKYAAGYDYVMRLDDDAFIEEYLPNLFSWAEEKKLVYASNIIHSDCGLCCWGMMDFFLKRYPEKASIIRSMFVESQLQSNSVKTHPFRALLSITQDPIPYIGDVIKLQMPNMFYNNFFITKGDFWQREEVQEAIKAIDECGYIYYFRWGDAPLQTLLVKMFAKPEEIKQAVFKYSKRMQRESLHGNDNMFYSYIPALYDKSSCLTDP